MSLRSLATRLTAMDREELRTRALCEARKAASRVRFAVAHPRWRRADLADVLDASAGPLVAQARDAASRGDHVGAHRVLARHFASRRPRWPVAAVNRDTLVDAIRQQFPMAAVAARDRAGALVEGRYDLLGYRGLMLGARPDWHRDAVHGRIAPRGFWAGVPFLDPASGDHKVIWEVNRHQHFLVLGAAWWLTGADVCRHTFVAQIEDWMATNPPLDGINWASMLELAFRSISWTWALEFFCAGAEHDDTPWLVDLLVALDRQLTHVAHNLSTYFSPNTHLTGEALGLYAVSQALPELSRSAARAATGRSILTAEIDKQIRPDGGHAELSSHYHRYTTDFYLLATLVARLTEDRAAAVFEPALRRAAAFLRTIADTRGHLPNIGDDDGGQLFRFGESAADDASSTLAACAAVLDDPALAVSKPRAEVFWILGDAPAVAVAAAVATEWPSRLLTESGYFVARDDARGHHLVFDAGPHGFLNGGHAHADALSVVLTVNGEPLLVDPGTGTYTMVPAVRDQLRAPQMHNTVTVDDAAFAEPRGPFHWDRIANARMLSAGTQAGREFAVGTHDGYGFPVTRALIVLAGHGWLIVDHAAPPTQARVDAWWHLHPSWTAAPADNGFSLTHNDGRRLALATTASESSIEMQLYAPEYGRLEHAIAVRTRVVTSGPAAMAVFVPAAVRAAMPRVALAGVKAAAQPGWRTYVFAVSGEAELLVSVTFPDRAQPDGRFWPQPCIQEVRAVCVE